MKKMITQQNQNKKRIKKRMLNWLVIFFMFVIAINLIHGSLALFTKTSLILKVKPLHQAYILAHGGYVNRSAGGYYHQSIINGKKYPTVTLLDELRHEGYNYIWISMCEQGDQDYVLDYGNGERYSWGDDVSRVHRPGYVIPIFYGVGVYRATMGAGYL